MKLLEQSKHLAIKKYRSLSYCRVLVQTKTIDFSVLAPCFIMDILRISKNIDFYVIWAKMSQMC